VQVLRANTLAVAGPGQSFLLLSGNDLRVLDDTSYVLANQGGTAVAWHPTRLGTLVAGDTGGRLREYPRGSLVIDAELPPSVAAIAFSGDGQRVACGSTQGDVVVIDPNVLGPVLTLQSVATTDLTGLEFNPMGRRLLAVHGDGTVLIWEAGSDRPPLEAPPADPPWMPQRLLSVKGPGGIVFREPLSRSVALDKRGRLHAVYARFEDADSLRSVSLGHEGGDGRWSEQFLQEHPYSSTAEERVGSSRLPRYAEGS
jgi:WD40 repeat protein